MSNFTTITSSNELIYLLAATSELEKVLRNVCQMCFIVAASRRCVVF